MSQPETKSSVRLLIGLASPEPALIDEVTGRLALEFGQILLRSPRWHEKGGGAAEGETVTRQWAAFDEPFNPVNLPSLKRHALRVEELYWTPRGHPRIRLEVAYLDPLRVVRATAADAPHRIYLGCGIYGEVLLQWREGAGPLAPAWMRPESATPELMEFMSRVHTDWLALKK